MTAQDLSKSTLFLLDSGTLTLPAADVSGSIQTLLKSGAIVDGKYRVLNLLGTGGMGAVYRVQHLLLGNEIALKTFQRIDLSGEELLRFEREAKALANLTHKHLVKVFDYGLHNGVPYYTMEYLEGESLAECLAREGWLSLSSTVQIFVQVVQALKYIHAKKIVHRDLKPGNIFLQRPPHRSRQKTDIAYEVRLVDFGIASITSSEENQKLTSSGRVIGSPLYMSPEQGLGMHVGSASDNYSLGCAIFATLTGSPPFRGKSALATILLHQNNAPPRLATISGVTYPERLEALVARLLAKNPQKRLADLDVVSQELLSVSSLEVAVVAPAAPDARSSLDEQTYGEIVGSKNNPNQGINVLRIFAIVSILTLLTGAFLVFRAPNTNARKKLQTVVEPVVVAQKEQPYLYPQLFRITVEKGQSIINANFPDSGEVGEFAFDTNHYEQASGRKKWPIKTPIFFTPSRKFVSDLRNLDQLKRLNLVGLTFFRLPRPVKSAQLFEYLTRFTTLQYIDIKNGDYGDKDILPLQKLPNLTELRVGDSNVTGSGLAKLPMLKNFDSLDFSGCKDVSPMLEAFQSASRLTSLRLDQDKLQPKDWIRISNFNKLYLLSVNNTHMTNAQLDAIARLKYLQNFHARGADVTDSCYQTILLMKKNGLKKIELGSRFLSEPCCQKMSALFSKSTIYHEDGTLPFDADATKFTKKEIRNIGDVGP